MKDVLLSFVVYLPTSKTLGYGWGIGSLLGFFYGLQLLTGVMLVVYYSTWICFESVQFIMYEVNGGWLMRILHFDGASLFYFFLYSHIFKGLFMMSFRLVSVWLVGVSMLFLFMGAGFLGYTLVCSQMSYWAAIVITSMLMVIPHFGESIVFFVWGSFSVVSITLDFFFLVHFLLPWLGGALVLLHLIYLHNGCSTSILYSYGDYDKVAFYPYYWFKDSLGLVVFFVCVVLVMFYPFVLADSEMFMEADALVSPMHIAPEWYFLFAYAILRAIPGKVAGIIAMALSVGLLSFLVAFKGPVMANFNSVAVMTFIFSCVMLTWLGSNLPEVPYVFLSQLYTFCFFFYVFLVLLASFFAYGLYALAFLLAFVFKSISGYYFF